MILKRLLFVSFSFSQLYIAVSGAAGWLVGDGGVPCAAVCDALLAYYDALHYVYEVGRTRLGVVRAEEDSNTQR